MTTPVLALKRPSPKTEPWRPVHRFNVRDVVAEAAILVRGVALDKAAFSDLDFESDWNLWLYFNLVHEFNNDGLIETMFRWFGQPVMPNLTTIMVPHVFTSMPRLELGDFTIEAHATTFRIRSCYSPSRAYLAPQPGTRVYAKGVLSVQKCDLDVFSSFAASGRVTIQECYAESISIPYARELLIENSLIRRELKTPVESVVVSNSVIGFFHGPFVCAQRLSIVHDIHIAGLPENARDLWQPLRGNLVGGGARLYAQVFEEEDSEANSPPENLPLEDTSPDEGEQDTNVVDL